MNAVIENNKTAHDLLERLYPHFLGAMQKLFDGSEEFDEANITQVIISKAARYIVEEGYGHGHQECACWQSAVSKDAKRKTACRMKISSMFMTRILT